VKAVINWIADPAISFTLLILVFLLVFPLTNRLERLSKRLKIDLLWTKQGGIVIFGALFLFFGWGITDENFRLIVSKPDNVPIVGLIFLVAFFVWYSMKQARENDQRTGAGGKPLEALDKEKILVWPDLIYVEFISLILATVLLFAWSILVKAPLEEPANPTLSPNPSKAPWYFLGLQEMLVYYDPWLAGVVLPTLIIVGLIAIPYMDTGEAGRGFYSFTDRKRAISTFMFGFLLLWTFLIIVGTFLRGPNWNFFGPFEFWDANKRVVSNNVNLSEYVYVFLLETGLPRGWLVREIWGILLVLGYFAILPGLLAKTAFRNLYDRWGTVRDSFFIVLLLMGLALPIKMYGRWLFNLKYIVSIPEFFLNI
jgi:hypothetical protein